MKKSLFLILVPVLAFAQSIDQNYIKSTIYKGEGATLPQESIVYLDGFGRPIQKINNNLSNSGKNIVTYVEYDALGRRLKEFLPYKSGNSSLDYVNNSFSELMTYYSSPDFSTNGNPDAEATNNPYTEALVETPSGLILKKAAQGNDWAMGSGHEVKYDYQTNLANEVKYLNATATWNSSKNLFEISISQNGFYLVNELYKNIIKNENWTSGDNNTTQEFKDKEGRLILKRTFNQGDAHETYYVYDQFGNLTYVIPPLAEGAFDQITLDGLSYQYKYDNRNRLVAKKLPGKQWDFFVYDKMDRVVASGPAYSPSGDGTSVVLVTEYDVYGRISQTGWKSLSMTENSRSGWHSDIANGVNPFVLNTNDILIKNYYDNYNFPDAPTLPATLPDSTYPIAQNVKGLPTGSWIKVLDAGNPNFYEFSYIFYDDKYRPVHTYTQNHLGGYTQVDVNLDFMGKTLYTVTKHKKEINDTEIVAKNSFEYTLQDRLLTHKHRINNDPEKLIAKNTYDELGQLITKNVGGDDLSGDYALQKVDYNYNIRGWLKSINNTDKLDPGDGFHMPDMFAFKISYNYPTTATPLYNGNISETHWRGYNDDILRKYDYTYDHLNRLLDAKFSKPEAANYVNSYAEQLSYDKNGNILDLARFGGTEDDVYEYPIDKLAYTYHTTNKNQLIKVVDNSLSPQGFKDGNTSGDDYEYDENGNMTKDLNKGIKSDITYNHLNLPVKIVFNNSELTKIEYIYNALGIKISKTVNCIKRVPINCNGGGESSKTTAGVVSMCFTDAPATDVTDYLSGGFQYLNNFLQFFPHAEGYIKYIPAAYPNPTESFVYVFNYKDHLGNVRMSYEDAGGYPNLVDENNYYPFGAKHEGYNYSTSTTYKYKFQEQERQDELGLNWDSFKYRNYDAAIGRFMSIDPLTEKYHHWSPYVFGGNQVVHSRELEGLEPEDDLNDDSTVDAKNTTVTPSFDGKSENKSDMDDVLIERTVTVNREHDEINEDGYDDFDEHGIATSEEVNEGEYEYEDEYAARKSVVEPSFMKYLEVGSNSASVYDMVRSSSLGHFVRNGRAPVAANAFRYGGAATGVVGLAYGYYQYNNNQISGLEFSIDTGFAALGIAAALVTAPAWGTAALVAGTASLVYFGGKAVYEYGFNETLFDKPKN